MKDLGLVLAIALVVLLLGGVLRSLRRRQRREAGAIPLTETERELLIAKVPLYACLPSELQDKLEGLIQVFLHEVGFEPCGKLEEVTREMQLIVASQACLLLLGSGYNHFGLLRSVLVYPDAYEVRNEMGIKSIRLGESWKSGSVVLSWKSVRQGAKNPEDGLNVVIHEFAHQLDQYNGTADGLPVLKERADYPEWATVMRRSFADLLEKVENGRRTVLDDYGATNPAEFFAVATETFFEKPVQLEKKHPDLYRQLGRFYGLDPLQWEDPGSKGQKPAV